MYRWCATNPILLQIPIVGILAADDPSVRSTVAAIERELVIDGSCYATRPERASMVYRLAKALSCRAASGSPTITRCRTGAAEARAPFESLPSLEIDVGLFAEVYDPKREPQELSHGTREGG